MCICMINDIFLGDECWATVSKQGSIFVVGLDRAISPDSQFGGTDDLDTMKRMEQFRKENKFSYFFLHCAYEDNVPLVARWLDGLNHHKLNSTNLEYQNGHFVNEIRTRFFYLCKCHPQRTHSFEVRMMCSDRAKSPNSQFWWTDDFYTMERMEKLGRKITIFVALLRVPMSHWLHNDWMGSFNTKLDQSGMSEMATL